MCYGLFCFVFLPEAVHYVLANGARQITLDIRLKSGPLCRAVSETFGLGLIGVV